MKDIYVTGHGGYLGRAFVKAGYCPLPCNVTDYNSVARVIDQRKPSMVIHLASKSNVDWCENHVKESSLVNVTGTSNITLACSDRKIPVIVLSSYHVWGGGALESLWNNHTEFSRMTPARNVYGMQKSAGEAVAESFNIDGWSGAKIVRTSYIFDRERLAPTLYDLKHERPIDAPRFLKRSFLHLDHFIEMMEMYTKWFWSMPPILHLAGRQTVSYYEFWKEVAKQLGFGKNLVKGRRIEKNHLEMAKRPHNGGLNTDLARSLGFPSYDYIDGIGRMKDES